MIIEVTGKLIINYDAREWCKRPYHGHQKGCPNYAHKPGCPPKAMKIEQWLDGRARQWFVYYPFNLKDHAAKMMKNHRGWSERQARCCLYWQAGVTKRLLIEVINFIFSTFEPSNKIAYTLCPEAMGLDVISTAQRVGIPIKLIPEDIAFKIALVG